MPQKAMVFIDGSWFYHSRQILFDLKDETGFEIDYKRLPLLVGQWVGDALDADVDVVRACYFGTLPLNKPGYNPAKQRVFYQFLQQDCGYEVEVLEMDHRLEHGISDDRRVGVALAASMMHFASTPGAFDTAILVEGSSDYRPLLRRVRDRGKCTFLVAMNNARNRQATSPVLLVDHALFDAPAGVPRRAHRRDPTRAQGASPRLQGVRPDGGDDLGGRGILLLQVAAPTTTAAYAPATPAGARRRRPGTRTTSTARSAARNSEEMGALVPKKPRSPSSAATARAPIAIGFVSLGCSKNLVDLQVMAAELHQGGFDIGVEVDEADAVIVNTCAFIEDAREEAVSRSSAPASSRRTAAARPSSFPAASRNGIANASSRPARTWTP